MSFSSFEVSKANLNLAVSIFQDAWEKLVHHYWLILREEEICNRRVATLFNVLDAEHCQAGAIDEEGNTLEITHTDEVGTVFNDSNKPLTIAFGSLLIANIPNDFRRANDASGVIFNGRDGEGNRDALPVIAHSHGFKMFDSFTSSQAGNDLIFLSNAFRRDHKRDVSADSLIRSEPKKTVCSSVAALNCSVE